MSQTFDVNILVYATDAASPFHDRAQALVRRFAAGPELVYLLWPVALGYLRIVTHPTVLDAPLPVETAEANVASLLGRPHVRPVAEAEGFFARYRRVSADVKPRGNLIPDAHLVALMHQHGISTMWSHDRDMRKFSGITVRDPFTD